MILLISTLLKSIPTSKIPKRVESTLNNSPDSNIFMQNQDRTDKNPSVLRILQIALGIISVIISGLVISNIFVAAGFITTLLAIALLAIGIERLGIGTLSRIIYEIIQDFQYNTWSFGNNVIYYSDNLSRHNRFIHTCIIVYFIDSYWNCKNHFYF